MENIKELLGGFHSWRSFLFLILVFYYGLFSNYSKKENMNTNS